MGSSERPLLSVVIPTHNRVAQLCNLLRGLAKQTLPAEQFEVLVSDDGSTDEVVAPLEALELPYDLTLLRQDNAGPAAARNRALERVKGLFTLILNDDAVPDAQLLALHLSAHSRRSVPVAVLGSFPYAPQSLRSPFVRLMEESDLIFDFASMRDGHIYEWRYFWTCNISLSTRAIIGVGGFDESFKEPMCEDIELGYRLQKLGVSVLYQPEARCLHDHDISPERYVKRQESLGRNLVTLCELHPEAEMARTWGMHALDVAAIQAVERIVSDGKAQAPDDLERLRQFEAQPLPQDERKAGERLVAIEPIARRLSQHHCRVGMVEEWARRHGPVASDPILVNLVEANGSAVHTAAPELFSIVIPCIDGIEHTRACLDSIAANTPEPHEIIVVDNGSTRETLEILRARSEITLLEMGRNIGAPQARNRATAATSGDVLVYLDNDTRVGPGWLGGLAEHTRVNPRVGLVGPMSNHVSGTQKLDDPGYDPARLDEHARAIAERSRGRHHYTNRLILFCLYVKREVVDLIGGFDPLFGRWGFEDDDFCLRAALAGYRMRVAEDVFVHHTGSQTSLAAQIDYTDLMETNWERFKTKWQIDAELPYGAPYPLQDILGKQFDPERHVVPIATTPSGARA